MPRVIDPVDDRTADLAELVDAIRTHGFDPAAEDSLNHGALWLRRLGNNRRFLGDLLIEQLARRHRDDLPDNAYGPQAIMLSPPDGKFFVRANLWPSSQDHAVRASGNASFVYGLPHDHNFDFLTVGYFGPGYWSDYFEYDYAEVAGFAGEEVPSLRFVERSRLAEGKLMHYRAHRDVHAQHPADSLSVSLNLMHMSGAQGWLDQYRFDLDSKRIAGIVSTGPSEAFMRIAVGLGGEEALDLAHRFAQGHPSERMRLCAFDALAGIAPSDQARDALWRTAEQSGNRLVAMEAQARRAALAG